MVWDHAEGTTRLLGSTCLPPGLRRTGTVPGSIFVVVRSGYRQPPLRFPTPSTPTAGYLGEALVNEKTIYCSGTTLGTAAGMRAYLGGLFTVASHCADLVSEKGVWWSRVDARKGLLLLNKRPLLCSQGSTRASTT